jgi:hypothetical protein
MSRWVCLRCFEPNEEAFAACQSCGLPRGERPAADDSAYSPAASPAPSAGRVGGLLPLLLRFWWVILLVAVPVAGLVFNAQRGGDGAISRSGDLAVADLRVGDCFDLKEEDEDEDTVDDVTARPCSEPHEFEMMHTGTVPSDGYPSDAVFGAWLEANCLPAFERYVGLEYPASTLDVTWFQPTPDGWADGDHTVQCAIYDPADPELTEAVRDAAR